MTLHALKIPTFDSDALPQNARISPNKRSGLSVAAKCPPLLCTFLTTTLPFRRAQSRGFVRKSQSMIYSMENIEMTYRAVPYILGKLRDGSWLVYIWRRTAKSVSAKDTLLTTRHCQSVDQSIHKGSSRSYIPLVRLPCRISVLHRGLGCNTSYSM